VTNKLTRREVLALLGSAALLPAQDASPPAPPVAVAQCGAYTEDLAGILATMMDQIGGLDRIVKGKTVTIKLNLTGDPGLKLLGRPLGSTHYTHPLVIEAFLYLLDRAGARRVRLVESCWATGGPLEEYMLDSGWRVRRLMSAAKNVEFENTNALGRGKRYSRLPVPGGAYMFPAYDLNHSYEDTDVFVSMAKLKEHDTCGVTLSLKNCFGIIPASIYGDDAGEDEPNEKPTKGRALVIHAGKRPPSRSAPQELPHGGPQEGGYRVSRTVADLVRARPIDLAIIDGVESMAGGEGPWIKNCRPVSPGVLIAGTNPVTTDAVATAIMGFDPMTPGYAGVPFATCENTMQLVEAKGLGSRDLKRIDVRGVPIETARFPFRG
jgi:uncharacterized protein (DUF362 family)